MIRGEYVDPRPTEAPIGGAWVIALRPADAAPMGLGVADAFGRYEIGGLGLGAYRVADYEEELCRLDAEGHAIAPLPSLRAG